MSLEEILLHLFDKTLDSNTNDHLQTILASQTKIIQLKKENVTPTIVLQKSSIQQKLDTLDKKILNKDSFRSKRQSKNDNIFKTVSQHENSQKIIINNNNDDQRDQSVLKLQNKQLQTLIASLEFKQREQYLQNCNQIKQIQQEKEQLLENNTNLNQKQQKLNQRSQTLLQKQMILEKQEKQMQYQILSIQDNEQEQQKNDELLNERREHMEGLQIKLNEYVSQLLNLVNSKNKVENQLTIQFDAIEFLIQYILKERSILQSEQQYLRKFKQDVLNQKKQVLQLKDQFL
ncbi:unnamed protein product [Paramecium pentaurelia]|uniref:Uncharacterized protein n=1 Tax=Paramecium pentaurelia TaxID=43138 RepID=A0A8S1XUJ3_9CILI|nr:unnamed protein product [Paramecium pentaurelia]